MAEKFLTTRQLVTLTDLSKHQLRAWLALDWIRPDAKDDKGWNLWDPVWVEIIKDMMERVDNCPYSHRLERKK